MKPKNFKIKNDLCEYYSPAKAATTSVAVTTAEASCMLLQIEKLREMIQRTILAQHQYKLVDILSANDINLSVQYLEKIYQNLEKQLVVDIFILINSKCVLHINYLILKLWQNTFIDKTLR